MVRKSLMDIVTLSGVRKDVLLYLNDGPRSLSEIREHLNITSPEVSPRIKELLGHNLVEFEGKKYQLTPIGKTLVNSFILFNNTLNVFDQDSDWWEEHDVSSIPEELLFRIGELKNFNIIEDDTDNVNRTFNALNDLLINSKEIAGVGCAFDESFPTAFLNAAKTNIPISIVITNDILDLINTKYATLVHEFIKTGNSIYLLNENIKISHIVTENCLYFSLFYKNGKLDLHSNIVSNDPSSIQWGYDLFEYYRKRAVKIG